MIFTVLFMGKNYLVDKQMSKTSIVMTDGARPLIHNLT